MEATLPTWLLPDVASSDHRNAVDRNLMPGQLGQEPPSPERVENAELRRQLKRSQSDLQTARRVIEVQGNVSALLEELLAKSAPDQPSEKPSTP